MSDDVPTDQELIDGEAEHDCRLRVRDGHARQQDAYFHTPHHVQLEYECDRCQRTVYLICEPFNVQISQQDDNELPGSVLEPHPDVDRHEIYEHDDIGPA